MARTVPSSSSPRPIRVLTLQLISFLVLCSLFGPLASAGESRVVCYYTNWSAYRQGPAKFLPDNINPYLCTHLIYAFGGLTSDSGIKPFDKYQDVDKGGYTKFNGLKTYNKGLKTLIAIGGWNEGSGRFSKLVADADSRKTFIKHSIRFLRQHHFDGLDLDWEYPAARDGGEPEDKKHYALFIKELREAFEDESRSTGRARLLLTIAVPAGIEWIEKGYDVPSINKNVDFFNLLTYDYHASTEPTVNHHAPLKPKNGFSEYDYKNQLNIEYTISHYLQEGADADKLVVGLPTYGRSYTLFNIESSDIGAPASGPGTKGKYTKEPGYLAYYEICEGVKSGDWSVENTESDAQGPHAVNGDQWIGYDDPRIMAVKAKWVREMKLGGIMFWSVDNDDFRGTCHGKPFPLIEAAKTAYYTGETPPAGAKLGGTRSSASASRLSTRRTTTTTPAPPSTTTGTPAGGRKNKKNNRRRPKTKPTTTTRAPTTTSPPPTSDPLRTPPPPTTPDPGVDFECKDEGFFPHPRECKKYFWCLDAPGLGLVAHHFTCPAGLFFNKNADSCDYARNVPCKPGGEKTTTTTTTEEPTTSKTTTTESPEADDEYYDDEDEEEEVVVAKPKNKSKPKGIVPQTNPKSAQEIRDIKNLLSIIRKLGGVEELEKYLADNPGISSDLVEEYEDEDEEEKPEKTTTPKPPAVSSIFPNRNRFTPAASAGRAKFSPSNNRRTPTSEESSEEVIVTEILPSSTTTRQQQQQQSTTRKPRPKYVTLNRVPGSSSSTTPSSKEKSYRAGAGSSTETSVVVRFSNEEKLLDEQTAGTEKPYVTISRPYAKVNGVLEHETPTEEKAKDSRSRYVQLARVRITDGSKETTSKSPIVVEYVDEEEYTEEELDDEPVVVTSSTTTTVKPRVRIPGRGSTTTLNQLRSSRSTTTTTTPAPSPSSPRNNRNFATGARRNLLLERKRYSSTTEAPEDEGTDESISILTASAPGRSFNPTRTRTAYYSNNGNNNNIVSTSTNNNIVSTSNHNAVKNLTSNRGRTRFRTTTTTASSIPDDLATPYSTTLLTPLTGSFQSAFIRRRTRRPTSTFPTTTTRTTRTTTMTTTTTTPRPVTTTTQEPIDYYYYYYDEEPDDLFAKSPSQSIQSLNANVNPQAEASSSSSQFLRRSLDLGTSSSSSSSSQKNDILTKDPVKLSVKVKDTQDSDAAAVEAVTPGHRTQVLVPLSQKIILRKDGSIQCLDVGVFPHPLSCKMYVNCVVGDGMRGWVYTCSKHLTFDPIGGMCNWSPAADASSCHDLTFE